MEESDKLILASVNRLGFQLGKELDSLTSIDSDLLLIICKQFLQKLNWKYNLPQSNQKFRIATKMSEEIMKASGVRVDINALMNPNINDLRKIIVAIISKLAMSEEDEGKQKVQYETFEEKINLQKKDIRVQTLKQWLKEDWIHPALSEKNCNSYRTYETYFSLHGPSARTTYMINPFEKQIKVNMFSSLVKTISYSIQQAKIEAVMKGQEQSADHKQEILQQHQVQLEDMKQKNQNEWTNVKKKKINKIVEQLKKQVQQEEPVQAAQSEAEQQSNNITGENQEQQQQAGPLQQQVAKPDEDQTLYNLQMQFQEEQQPSQLAQSSPGQEQVKQGQQQSPQKVQGTKKAEFDLEEMRKNHQEEIDELSKQLEKITTRVEKQSKKKTQLEELIVQRTDEIEVLKEENIQMQKKVEQMHLLLKQFDTKEGGLQLKKEITALENEIQNIEKEWDTINQQIQAQIYDIRNDINQRRDKIELQKEKARRIDTDYQQLINNLRQGQEEQEQLLEEYKKLPKDSNRTIYVKRISEISANYNKLRTEFSQIVKQLKEYEDSINFQQQSLQRHQTEFENCYNMDQKKNDSVNKNIFKLFQDYRDTMDKTIQNLKELSKKKIEQREFDIKLEILQSKNYKNTIQKLQNDLQEIKLENEKMEKMI